MLTIIKPLNTSKYLKGRLYRSTCLAGETVDGGEHHTGQPPTPSSPGLCYRYSSLKHAGGIAILLIL